MAHRVDATSINANYGSNHDEYYDSDVSSSTTGLPTENDRAILLEEEQQERLLATDALSREHGESQSSTEFPKGRREHRKQRRRQRKSQRQKTTRAKLQEEHLMYEMEDVEPEDNVGWHSSPSSLDLDMLKQQSNLKVWLSPQDRDLC